MKKEHAPGKNCFISVEYFNGLSGGQDFLEAGVQRTRSK
jgi:hypothetical protein